MTSASEHLANALRSLAILKDRLVGNGADKVLKAIFDNLDKVPPSMKLKDGFWEDLFKTGIVKEHDGKRYKFTLSRGD